MEPDSQKETGQLPTDDSVADPQVAQDANQTSQATAVQNVHIEPVKTEEADVPTTNQHSKITLDQLVNLSVEKEASDIHFSEDNRVALRVRGKIVFIENLDSLSSKDAREMIFAMLSTEEEQKRLERIREVDFSYTHSNGVSFRVNVFYKRGKLSVVMRMISKNLPNIDDLGIPDEFKKLLTKREGLIIVSGTAGSGKSTTIQAVLEYINQNFVEHIITIENPIEYVFSDNKSIFSQREIGKDTLTVSNALHSAAKEDPNIIMVSDINDVDTLNSVLTIAETGYLVIAAMSTKDSRQTLERMVTMYPQSHQSQAQERIGDNLIAILSQDLINRVDRPGRIAVYELLISDSGIRSMIKRGNMSQLRTAMQSGAKDGMMTMDTYAYHLAEQGIIPQDVVANYSEQE